MVYVLRSVYGWDRATIAERLLNLVNSKVFTVLEQRALVQTLQWYRTGHGLGFADAYVAAVARARGHGSVISFDRGLRHIPGIALVQDAADLNP